MGNDMREVKSLMSLLALYIAAFIVVIFRLTL